MFVVALPTLTRLPPSCVLRLRTISGLAICVGANHNEYCGYSSALKDIAPSMPLTSEIFGEQAVPFVRTIRQIIPNLKCSVSDYYQSASDYYWQSSQTEWLYLYWHELFGRAYIAASASLIRHNQWISGIEGSYQANSYLGLCSCVRGLLESTADSMYTLECFLPTVANVWHDLKKVFGGVPLERPFIAKELEDSLIHFGFARRVNKGDEVPDGHKARSNRDYIDTIRKADPQLEELYCALVELVHPAKDSVHWMLQYEQKKTHWKVSLNSGEEAATKICELLDTYKSALFSLVVLSCNFSLFTLKGLREMNLKDMDLSFMDEVNLDGVPAWRQFMQQIRN